MTFSALYICVRDMNRAENFYRQFFEAEPVSRNEEFVFFDVGGVLFGLFDPSVREEPVEYGNNCVPNLETDDVDAVYDRVQHSGVEADAEIRRVNEYRLFQFTDPEGNLIEVYEKAPETESAV
jgi:predicted enzyme related to lactoylglutathione lyase